MTDEPVLDVELVSDGDQGSASTGPTSGVALAPVQPQSFGSQALGFVQDTNRAVEAARLEGRALRMAILRILEPGDVYEKGKTSFVEAPGWDRVCKRLRVTRKMLSNTVERNEKGDVVAAAAVWSAEWEHGYEEGDGYAGDQEKGFEGDGNQGGRAKLENALRTRASTRAKKRAAEALFGVGKITRRDVVAAHQSAGLDLPMGQAFDPSVHEKAHRALHYLFGDDEGVAGFLAKLTEEHGYAPLACVRAAALGAAAHRSRTASAPPPSPDPVDADVITEPEATGAGEQIAIPTSF